MATCSQPDRSPLPALPARPADGHKGTFGRVLIVAGSTGMTGAAALAGEAALRAGSGLVYLAVAASLNPIVETLCREVVTRPVAEDEPGTLGAAAIEAVLSLAADCDALCVGPGLGQAKGTGELVRALIARVQKPLVLDADGINLLAGEADLLRGRPASTVITPHPGEMQRIAGTPPGERATLDETARVRAATSFSTATGVVVLLKGKGTVIAEATPAGRYAINPTGNSGMATAGSGDVLAGVVTSLLGQGLGAFDAARLGAYLHGLSGDLAARELGEHSLIAGDLLRWLPQAFRAHGTEQSGGDA